MTQIIRIVCPLAKSYDQYRRRVALGRGFLFHSDQGTHAAMDFALRVAESTAFALHSALGITEPCHGTVESTLGGAGSLPRWFWPTAGLCLGLVSYANFSGSSQAVLCAQAYIVAFHSGAMFWHWRLQHHPVAALAPGVFVVLAAIVAGLRVSIFVALLGTAICAAFGVILGLVLVTPPQRHTALLG